MSNLRINKGMLFEVGDGFEEYYLERFEKPSKIKDGDIMQIIDWLTPPGQELSILGRSLSYYYLEGWIPARYTDLLPSQVLAR